MTAILKNQIYVPGTLSPIAEQKCELPVEKVVRIFSFKHCETEDPDLTLRKGRDVAFTVVAKNMGECPGLTSVTDVISVSNIGGVVFKVQSLSNTGLLWNCNRYYWLLFGGWFYNGGDEDDAANYSFQFKYGWQVCGKKFLVRPGYPMSIFVLDGTFLNTITLNPHSIVDFSLLCQVENIWCNTTMLPVVRETEEIVPPEFDERTKEAIRNEMKGLLMTKGSEI